MSKLPNTIFSNIDKYYSKKYLYCVLCDIYNYMKEEEDEDGLLMVRANNDEEFGNYVKKNVEKFLIYFDYIAYHNDNKDGIIDKIMYKIIENCYQYDNEEDVDEEIDEKIDEEIEIKKKYISEECSEEDREKVKKIKNILEEYPDEEVGNMFYIYDRNRECTLRVMRYKIQKII